MSKIIYLPTMTARQLRLSQEHEAVFLMPVSGADTPFAAGDILTVKEPWRQQPTEWNENDGYSEFEVQYQGEFSAQEDAMYGRCCGLRPWPWISAKEMPDDMCALTVQVLDIQKARLHYISAEVIDRMGEIHCTPSEACEHMLCDDCPQSGEDPVQWLAWAWDNDPYIQAHKHLAWNENPDLLVVNLKRHSERKDPAKATLTRVVVPKYF